MKMFPGAETIGRIKHNRFQLYREKKPTDTKQMQYV